MIYYTNNVFYSTLNVKCYSVVCWLLHRAAPSQLRYTQPVSQQYTPLQTSDAPSLTSKHKTLTRCCINVGPLSSKSACIKATLGQWFMFTGSRYSWHETLMQGWPTLELHNNTIHCLNEPSTPVYSHVANVQYEVVRPHRPIPNRHKTLIQWCTNVKATFLIQRIVSAGTETVHRLRLSVGIMLLLV